MTQLSFQAPQIEVLFSGRRRDDLLGALSSAGFRPITAPLPVDMRTSVPLVLDLSDKNAKALKDPGLANLNNSARPIVIFGGLTTQERLPPSWIHISEIDAIAGLRARLALRRRALLRDNERELREETAREFDSPIYQQFETPKVSEPKVLFVGPVGARFLPLSKGLAERGIQTFAAMTIQTARMHLNSEVFQLLLVDPTKPSDGIAELVQGRGDLPVYVLGSPVEDVFDGCVDLEGDCEVAYDFIAHRARTLPLQTQLEKVRLGATSHDPLTGLYSQDFLKAHLPRQMQACTEFETPLTLLHIRHTEGLMDRGDLSLVSKAMVKNLRETDLLVRMDQSSFIAALRDTSYTGAAHLATRVLSVLGELPDTNSMFRDRFVWRAVERRGSFTPEGLLRAVQNGPYSRSIAA